MKREIKIMGKAVDLLRPIVVKPIHYINVELADTLGDMTELTEMESKIRMISAVTGMSIESIEMMKSGWIDATYLRLFYAIDRSAATPTVFTFKGKTYGFRDPKHCSGRFIQDLQALGDLSLIHI